LVKPGEFRNRKWETKNEEICGNGAHAWKRECTSFLIEGRWLSELELLSEIASDCYIRIYSTNS